MKTLIAFLLTATLMPATADQVVERFIEHVANHPEGKALHSFEKDAYAGELSRLPIGVFDSGIGGLTVLEAILELDAFDNETLKPGPDGVPDFQNERFIYFGDQANMPYGNYPKAGRTDYLRELILRDATFLLGRRYSTPDGDTRYNKPPVKAIVIACNTGTAFGLEDIRKAIKAWNVPVIVVGVVEAGARGVRESRPDSPEALAVMATAGTCESGAYPRMITRALGLAGRPVPPIVQQGGVNLAAIIEGDPNSKVSVEEETLNEIRKLLETHAESGIEQPIGTIVLGCTHYPLAISEINKALDHFRKDETLGKLIAPEVSFVDPARWTATELFRELAAARLRMKSGESSVIRLDQFYMSVANPESPGVRMTADGNLDREYKYGRMPGNFQLEDTRAVMLMADQIPTASLRLVENRLPLVWTRLSTASSLSE